MQKKSKKRLNSKVEPLASVSDRNGSIETVLECRICRVPEAKSNRLLSLFDNNLYEIFNELTQIQVKFTTGFKGICQKCVQTLKNFHKFRELCIESHVFFEKLEADLDKDEIKQETDVRDQPTEIYVAPIIKIEVEQILLPNVPNEKSSRLKRNHILICDICLKEFRNKKTIREHMREIHMLKKSSQSTSEPTIVDLTCNICHKIFLDKRKFSLHKFRHKLKESACPHCGIMVKNMTTHLKRHTEEFERQMFQCDKCPKKYKSKYQLLSHLKEHENKEYPCPICGRPFNHPSKIREHVKVHNPNRQKFECEQCGKLFAFKKALTGHRRTHTNERPYECEVCGMAFRLSGGLKNHSFTHTGYRPFPCEHCTFGAYSKFDLRSHIKRIHPNVIITI